MKRTIKIFKAFWFMYPSNTEWLLRFSIFFTGLISIMICYDITMLVQDYVNTGTIINFSGIVVQVLNLINLSTTILLVVMGFIALCSWIVGSTNVLYCGSPSNYNC